MKFNYKFLLILLFSALTLFAQQDPNKSRADAERNIKYGRFGEAIDQLNKYVTAYPQDPHGFNLRAYCYEQRGQYDAAMIDYQRASKLDPNNYNYKASIARIKQVWNQDTYKKIEGFKREIARNPNSPVNYLRIALCYKDLENFKESEKWYDEYAKKAELSADETIRYVEVLIRLNKLKKAEGALTPKINKDPRDQRILSRRGWVRVWLGDYKNAISDFQRALEIKPYFKEAMDGLDVAKGKNYTFTYVENDTGRAHKEFAIDKYTRTLKKFPQKDDIRFLLVDELLKYKRTSEAQVHLEYLSAKYANDNKYLKLLEQYEMQRDSTYSQQLRNLTTKISKNNRDKQAVLRLMQIYAAREMYPEAVDLGDKFIEGGYDEEIAFLTAQYYTYIPNYDKALDVLKILTSKESDNAKYILLYCQISVWQNKNLEDAEMKLRKILNDNPKNFEALKTLALLNVILQKYPSADSLLRRASQIEPSNEDLRKLFFTVYRNRNEIKEITQYKKVEKANSLLNNKKYKDAIKWYSDYLNDNPSDKNVLIQLCNAQLASKDILGATETYNKILSLKYDYEYDKYKIKNIYWSGDSLNALDEFERLSKVDSSDVEVKMLIAEIKTKLKIYPDAKDIYMSLRDQNINNYYVNQRLSWLPANYAIKFNSVKKTFPTYLNASPEIFAFSDIENFKYQYQGLKFETGINDFLSASAGLYLGEFSASDNLKVNSYSQKFTNLKASIFFFLPNNINATLGLGYITYGDRTVKPTADFKINYSTDLYSATGTFMATDAKFLVYSSKLLYYRLNTNYLNLNGVYKIRKDVKASINTSLILIDGPVYRYEVQDVKITDDNGKTLITQDTVAIHKYRKNGGNDLTLRLGKEFYRELSLGYEYYLVKYVHTISEYYSPRNFESHGMWGDWQAFKTDEYSLNFTGKICYVFASDFIVKELNIKGSYNLYNNLSLNLTATFGSSARYETAYSSRMFNLSLLWSLQ